MREPEIDGPSKEKLAGGGKTGRIDKGPWGQQMRENVPQSERELAEDEA